jgi:hypothetical protein
LTRSNGTVADKKKAEQVVCRISNRGTIPEFKPTTRHSSAVKKTTKAKVVAEIKAIKFVANPIYAPFADALNNLAAEVSDIAKRGEVRLENGFSLYNNGGRPFLRFPEEYAKVAIGGLAIGDEVKNFRYFVKLKRIDGTDQSKIDEVALNKFKLLGEPEFYCTWVNYSVLPATRQVASIRMHGDLCVGSEYKAKRMVREIAGWMKEDYGAVDRYADVPEDMLAFKKLKIGKGMDVMVEVRRKDRCDANGSDAYITISFTPAELVEENLAERQELGMAADEARVAEFNRSGVNYFTVRPRVNIEDVKRKVVY